MWGSEHITPFQLGSILAFTQGLHSSDLAPLISRLDGIERSNPEAQFWHGSARPLTRAVRANLPYRIERLLARKKRIMNTREIAEELELPWNGHTRSLLSSASRLLRQMGVVKPQLPYSSPDSGAIRTLSHSKHGFLPIEHPSVPLTVLKSAYDAGERGVDASELYKLRLSRGRRYGKEDAEFTSTSITKALQGLEGKGFITTETKRRVLKGKGSRPVTSIRLTEKGRDIMAGYNRGSEEHQDMLTRELLEGD